MQTKKFRITHPFHPLSGHEFEALAYKEYSGEQRVCFLDKKGRQCELPLSWTDLRDSCYRPALVAFDRS